MPDICWYHHWVTHTWYVFCVGRIFVAGVSGRQNLLLYHFPVHFSMGSVGGLGVTFAVTLMQAEPVAALLQGNVLSGVWPAHFHSVWSRWKGHGCPEQHWWYSSSLMHWLMFDTSMGTTLALMMKAACTSDKSVNFYQITQCNITFFILAFCMVCIYCWLSAHSTCTCAICTVHTCYLEMNYFAAHDLR
jgi:hypothetical protein